MATLKLTLKKDIIFAAVKTDTYQTGQDDKAENPVANAARAYNEQAGDEKYHIDKLLRLLRSSLAKFAAHMAEYVDTEAGSITYTIPADDAEDPNTIEIDVTVSARYNTGLAQPLSSFAEEFIINMMDCDWWKPIKPSLAKDYFEYASSTLSYIKLCLAKTAPAAATSSYMDVRGEVVDDDTDPSDDDPVDPNEPSNP